MPHTEWKARTQTSAHDVPEIEKAAQIMMLFIDPGNRCAINRAAFGGFPAVVIIALKEAGTRHNCWPIM